ncbi:ring-1,2-phenylacetyl-CoA epoxidase subunit PaaD [Filimonas zeae]|uniref:Phenylacetic acid degradation protein n=1 Tax=Filimonas zeae TaxID=1737353 RepID=A0A917J220_9BACT|nr:1,2-phenylacetyl-CoA epoxidase subunit PaaD [Filimonas zeae]MDR6340975.1 ring-1,2-phenylacetyl-CoA epoxidase subunit PaaD [Filimonas zeae]GGH77722.1 phenylacetic acid degradation protein [Filimonas zeae]
MTVLSSPDVQAVWQLLENVYDPEVPVLSVSDLGIVRKVELEGDIVTVIITPTYSGCPAMDVIAMQIRMLLLQSGYKEVIVERVLSPAWTTDWITERGKSRLRAYGIAPPQYKVQTALFEEEGGVKCPNCQSVHTRGISRFGSTACKALYQCSDCNEPFDYFKCH